VSVNATRAIYLQLHRQEPRHSRKSKTKRLKRQHILECIPAPVVEATAGELHERPAFKLARRQKLRESKARQVQYANAKEAKGRDVGVVVDIVSIASHNNISVCEPAWHKVQ